MTSAATPTRDPIDRTAPCARCATAVGGKLGRRRVSGVRFGIDGILCRRCYNRLNEAATDAKRAAGPPVVRKRASEPASVFRSKRYYAVRDAKRLKWALGMTTDLTTAELDAVLPRGSGEGVCDV